MTSYPKRLIEVDLPIKRISAHARREKDMRRGHVPLIHIYPAARPPAACRAVICAALWPDPAPGKGDAPCPPAFLKAARREMLAWTSHERQELLSSESRPRFEVARRNPNKFDDPLELRQALLDFIADFANWDNSTVPEYLATSRALTQSAHEALGGAPGTKPLVFDPFAGGGAIPLEALRVGGDAFASDLNPVSVLLNKLIAEYIPKYGPQLIAEVQKYSQWLKKELEAELSQFYPKDLDGNTTIAFLWARTIRCEGPGCGTEIPLIRSLWLARKRKPAIALRLVARPRKKEIDIELVQDARGPDAGQGTLRRGSVMCPVCGFTTPVTSVRRQLRERKGGTEDARLTAVVTMRPGKQGRVYRLPTERDFKVVRAAKKELEDREARSKGSLSFVPSESTKHYHSFVNRGPIYGMTKWSDYFTPRQSLANGILAAKIKQVRKMLEAEHGTGFAVAVQTTLALLGDKMIDMNASLCVWQTHAEIPAHVFGRWALPMVFDFVETNPIAGSSGSVDASGKRLLEGLEILARAQCGPGTVELASATEHPLPDDSAQLLATDPPYYYSIQYADVLDFFYVWLRRMLGESHKALFAHELIQKDDEIIVQSPGHEFAPEGKNNAFYESRMKSAMREARRVLSPSGIGVVVFAHTSTAGWEALLQATIDAGWVVTGSWPIDTEMATRVISINRSVLASSVHLICRPRKNADGSLREDDVGDWRDVLSELPKRIHDWMPRLADEGVVGGDAIFACLGPALEVFSRYARVEKPGGETVTLKEYLVHVWAAIAREALNMIFSGADATGFEEDARLTAMWLWTLSTGTPKTKDSGEDSRDTDDEEDGTKGKMAAGYVMEYDAARKIAQGLGGHLEDLTDTIEVMGEKARLLPVSERTRYLFGKEEPDAPQKRKKHDDQMTLKGIEREVEEAAEESGWGEKAAPKGGITVLDRVHQAMILFAAGRGEAMKRFLVEEGIGNDNRFWKLAQALRALYPSKSDEKRWVDGVLARKKGLGF